MAAVQAANIDDVMLCHVMSWHGAYGRVAIALLEEHSEALTQEFLANRPLTYVQYDHILITHIQYITVIHHTTPPTGHTHSI